MTVEYPAYADDEYWAAEGPTVLAWSQEDTRQPLFGMEGRWDVNGRLVEHPSVLAPLAAPKKPMPLASGTILAGLAAMVAAIVIAYLTLLVVLM